MEEYKILEYKSNSMASNGEVFKDLLSGKIDTNSIIGGYPIIVNKYYVGRPDLISLAVYGNDRYADILCKINGISNPFELNEDNVMFIPNVEYISEYIKANQDQNEFVSNTSTDTLNKENIGYQKRKNEKRAPNEQIVGESHYYVDKSLGLVFY